MNMAKQLQKLSEYSLKLQRRDDECRQNIAELQRQRKELRVAMILSDCNDKGIDIVAISERVRDGLPINPLMND